MTTPKYRWSGKDLDDLEQFHYDEIQPAMAADGLETDEPPAYTWLAQNGFSGFIDYLKREHGLTVGDFYDDYGPDAPEDTASFGFIDHDRTRTLLNEYLYELEHDRNRAETTVKTRRSRLKKYAETYARLHETTDLVSTLDDMDARPQEIRRARDVFREFKDDLSTRASQRSYVQDIRQWYVFLVDTGIALYNPIERMERRFGWDEEPEYDNPTMSKGQVTKMFQQAASPRERLMIIGLAGWGLRPGELVSLHVSQMELETDGTPPYISFEDRKNGPGEVNMLVGTDAVTDRIAVLSDEYDNWSGHLFPSAWGEDPHYTTESLRNWFTDLAERCGVTVEKEVPKPKMGRRWWYTLYSDAVQQLLDQTEFIAEEQGSSDPETVLRNYYSKEQVRELRRGEMQDELAAVFDLDA